TPLNGRTTTTSRSRPAPFPMVKRRVMEQLHPATAGVLRIDDLKVDLKLQRAFRAGGRVRLTPKEFLLLVRLAAARGHVVSRRDLLADIWEAKDPRSNILESMICRLRQKVDRSSKVKLI